MTEFLHFAAGSRSNSVSTALLERPLAANETSIGA
jgi:hypothetical protein